MQDIILNQNGEIAIVNGDFVIADATLQHQHHIIVAQKGEYKEFPEIGVGIENMVLDENPRDILTQIRRNFEYDGMKVNSLDFSEDSILIDAPYK